VPSTDGRSGAPAGALRGHVAYHGYDLRGGPPGTHRGLPSPYLTLIVTFGRPLTMRTPDGGVVDRAVALGGLHTTPETIVHDGRQSGVHVVLDPLAARALLGRPAAEIAGVTVDGDDVLGAVARELAERVDAAAGWNARFAALDDVLLRVLGAASPARAAGRPVAPEVRHAWRRVVGSGGAVPVHALADEVGWSERHLGQRFRSEVGVGPKAAGRMARFDRARRRLAARAVAGAPLGLADIAAEGGYADQAHLSREFGALAGCSPTRWLAEEIGNVQDATALPAEDHPPWTRRPLPRRSGPPSPHATPAP
jgi:AraC-like DNA-binding protein